MSRPSAPAVISTAIIAADAVMLYAAGVTWGALILALLAPAALAVFWTIPRRTAPPGDMLALVEATREQRPGAPGEHFDQWEREITQL